MVAGRAGRGEEADGSGAGIQLDEGSGYRALRVDRGLVGVMQFGARQDNPGGVDGGPFQCVGEAG